MTDIRLGSMIIEDSGEGAPVVMVHGLGGSSNSFQTLISGLEGYRVIRPDLPGAGRSAQRPGRPGIEGLAASVQDCLGALGIRHAHFVGHSMGTLVCQQMAATNPRAVDSLTLFGAILEPPPAARQALKERAETVRREGMSNVADAVATGSVSPASRKANPVTAAFVRESLMRQDPAGYAAHCAALSQAKAVHHAAIDCPTLLIAGAEDPVAPVAMAEQLRERIPGARLEVLPGIAHWMMIEDVQRSVELLRGHLDEITPRRGT